MHTLKHFYILYLYSKLKCIINDISNRLTKRVSNMLRQQMIKIHLYAHCNDLFLLKLNQKLNFDTSPQPCLFAPMYVHTYIHMYAYARVSASKHVFVVCVALVLPAPEVPVPLGCRASYVRLLSLHRTRCEQVCVCVCSHCSFISSAFGVCFVFPLCFDSLLIKNN